MQRFCLAHGLLFAVALALPGECAQAADAVAEIHVSPNGNDADPGTETQPLATIDAARLKTRELVQKMAAGQVRVVIHGGVYRIEDPLVFTSKDGGTGAVNVEELQSHLRDAGALLEPVPDSAEKIV